MTFLRIGGQAARRPWILCRGTSRSTSLVLGINTIVVILVVLEIKLADGYSADGGAVDWGSIM